MRSPWHHACFSLRTGEALAAPALNATSCWRVEQRDGRIFVRDKISEAGRRMPAKPRPTTGPPGHMVIIGGGAAGYAAAEMCREGSGGGVTIVSDDTASPYDRSNLSKDYRPRQTLIMTLFSLGLAAAAAYADDGQRSPPTLGWPIFNIGGFVPRGRGINPNFGSRTIRTMVILKTGPVSRAWHVAALR